MKSKFAFTVILVCFGSLAFAQTSTQKNNSIKISTIGIEADVVPYILGGYHGSIWYGYKHLRFRGVYVNGTIDFGLSNGFEKNKIQVGAVIIDYFFKNNWKKHFLSTGLEYLDGNISNKYSSKSADYNTVLFTAGGGYVFKIYKNFYVAPHVAFTLRIAGDKTVEIDGYKQDTPFFQPEGGLRLGWHF